MREVGRGIADGLHDAHLALVEERLQARHGRVQAGAVVPREAEDPRLGDGDVGAGDLVQGVGVARDDHVEAVVAAVELDDDQDMVRVGRQVHEGAEERRGHEGLDRVAVHHGGHHGRRQEVPEERSSFHEGGFRG